VRALAARQLLGQLLVLALQLPQAGSSVRGGALCGRVLLLRFVQLLLQRADPGAQAWELRQVRPVGCLRLRGHTRTHAHTHT
jgi:hypothetical protein